MSTNCSEWTTERDMKSSFHTVRGGDYGSGCKGAITRRSFDDSGNQYRTYCPYLSI